MDALNMKKKLLQRDRTENSLAKFFGWHAALYVAGTWALRKVDDTILQAF